MKLIIYRGNLTDISAKKEALTMIRRSDTRWRVISRFLRPALVILHRVHAWPTNLTVVATVAYLNPIYEDLALRMLLADLVRTELSIPVKPVWWTQKHMCVLQVRLRAWDVLEQHVQDDYWARHLRWCAKPPIRTIGWHKPASRWHWMTGIWSTVS